MNKLFGVVIGSAAMAVISLGVDIATVIHTNRTIKKLNKSVGKVEELSEDKITDQMISKAVAKAADNKVDRYMQETEDEIVRAASRNLTNQAKIVVEREADVIRVQASEKISQQVADLDIEKLKTRVCDQAERHVLQKLDGCLDASAKKFQQQLDSAEKIYGGIAKAMAEKRLDTDDDEPFHVVLF